MSHDGPLLRPVYIPSLYEATTPWWPEPIWAAPAGPDLRPGTFVFASDGAFAGLVTAERSGVAIVPAGVVLAAAERLMEQPIRPPGHIGVEAQPLTPEIASALGVSSGVVVTWVDPHGPAAGTLAVMDVIDALEGQPIVNPDQWNARMLRLSADDVVAIGIRRGGEVRDARLVAVLQPSNRSRPLGLTLRAVRRTGSQVIAVAPGSVAAEAGLHVGDTITRIGDLDAPTPAQISRLFGAPPDGRPPIAVISQGERHRVVILDGR
jgi:serine protease Do